jgi:hypothetical protein
MSYTVQVRARNGLDFFVIARLPRVCRYGNANKPKDHIGKLRSLSKTAIPVKERAMFSPLTCSPRVSNLTLSPRSGLLSDLNEAC